MGCSCLKTPSKDTIIIDIDYNKGRRDSFISKNSNNRKETIILKKVELEEGKNGTGMKTESTFPIYIKTGNFQFK
jgi:hypothetical protein